MITKKQLENEVKFLEDQLEALRQRYALAMQDNKDASAAAYKAEHRLLLAKIKRDGELFDAVVIPATGGVYSEITTSFNDVLDGATAEIHVEAIS